MKENILMLITWAMLVGLGLISTAAMIAACSSIIEGLGKQWKPLFPTTNILPLPIEARIEEIKEISRVCPLCGEPATAFTALCEQHERVLSK